MKISVAISETEMEELGLAHDGVDDFIELLFRGLEEHSGKPVSCDVNIEIKGDPAPPRS